MIHTRGRIHTWTFDQTERWVNVVGEEVYIPAIEREYALNIMLFLLRNAPRFREAYLLQHPAPETVDLTCGSAVEWMMGRPLFQALRARVLVA